jgi:hypothetical protein
MKEKYKVGDQVIHRRRLWNGTITDSKEKNISLKRGEVLVTWLSGKTSILDIVKKEDIMLATDNNKEVAKIKEVLNRYRP